MPKGTKGLGVGSLPLTMDPSSVQFSLMIKGQGWGQQQAQALRDGLVRKGC